MSHKEYMPVENIKKYILSHYPYVIYDIIPIKFKDTDKQRAVYKFESSDGPKCLKKVYFDEGNLLFVYSVIQWFCSRGIKVPKLLPTKSGGRYVNCNNSLFIVTDWIDGRKCDYDIDNDVCLAAKNLGKMHKCSYGFKPIDGSFVRRDATEWYKTFNRRYLQLLQFSNTATVHKDDFSKKYMNTFDYYTERARHAVNVLSMVDDRELMSPAQKLNTICHLDYVNKNLIITDTGDLFVIDFDKSKIDIPIHDLGTFLKRILKRNKTCWDTNILTMVIANYEKERELNLTEFLGLFAFLEFPQKYWKVSRDYYNNRKDCNKKMFTNLLARVNEQVDDHYVFCKIFQSYIEDRFHIDLN